MSEVLDQSDINALLASVQAEVAAEEAVKAGPVAVSNKARRPTGPAFLRPDATVYDFKRPERVSKDQIRTLASIHEVFSRNLGAMLSAHLRTIIDVRVVGVEQLTYHDFIHSLPNPTCFMTLQAPPLEGQMCLEFSPLICYPIIDRLLGGTNAQLFIPQRPLTSIEWRLMNRIVERALENLSEVWKNLIEVRFELLATESNPELVHIVAPTEVVVFITFEIKIGQSAGTMSLCIPFNTIESVLSRLATQAWFYKPRPANDVQRTRLHRSLIKGTIPITAYLGRTTMHLSELRQLQPGDLIALDKRIEKELIVQIAGKNKFAGTIGQFRGHKAIKLTRAAETDEAL